MEEMTMPTGGPPPPGGDMPPEAGGNAPPVDMPEDGEMPNVSPEEQAQYDILVSNALEFIHGPTSDQVIQRMASGRDPTQAIGQIAAQLGIGQIQSASAVGINIDDAVLFHAGHEVVGALVEVAEAAGIIPENDESAVERAFFYALDAFGQSAVTSGIVGKQDQDNLKGIMEDMELRAREGETDIASLAKGAQERKPYAPPGGEDVQSEAGFLPPEGGI